MYSLKEMIKLKLMHNRYFQIISFKLKIFLKLVNIIMRSQGYDFINQVIINLIVLFKIKLF